MEKLSGKTALVTGSTDGVGRLVARKLAQAGARVLVLVHGRDAERGARVIAEHHRQLPAFGVDLCRCTRGGRRDHGGRNRRARPAIASSSLRRWPTEVTPMLIRSSTVSFGSTSASISLSRNADT